MRNVNHHIHIHVEAMTDTHTHTSTAIVVSMLGYQLIQSCEKEMRKKKKAENTADVGLELLWLRRLALTANREQRKNNVIYANTQKLMRA